VGVAAIVLAAGEASRFGSPKQLLLLPRVLDALRAAASIGEVVVVEGAHPLGAASDNLSRGNVRLATCDDWAEGPGASLRCGLAELGDDVEAAVVVLADGPSLAPEAVERVLADWRSHGGLVAASYAGDRGHPLVLGRTDWTDIPDEGLRDRPVRLVPCDDLGAPGDVDTPEDLP
jgi:CTP:molybdopterin cytidylyltransferase MocA